MDSTTNWGADAVVSVNVLEKEIINRCPLRHGWTFAVIDNYTQPIVCISHYSGIQILFLSFDE